MGEKLTQKQKLDAMVDDLYIVAPLFFRTMFRGHHNLSHNPMSSEFKVMGMLTRHGSLNISRIGKWLGISKSNMTANIDKLIEENMVERKSDPNDRRVINVSLTEKGVEYMNRSWDEAHEAVKMRLSSLTIEEMDSLYTSLENIRIILSKLNEVNPEMNPKMLDIEKFSISIHNRASKLEESK
jgi:DNA-binding MarR family transcriptional regulator